MEGDMEVKFWVTGIVSKRDKKPYVQLADEDRTIAQLTVGQARAVAQDILMQASRAEVDAMMMQFCEQEDLPSMGPVLMMKFRDFRAEIDEAVVGRGTDTKDERP